MKPKKVLFALVPAVLVGLSCASLAAGQLSFPPQPGIAPPPEVVQAEKHDVSPALRDIPVIPPPDPPVFREIPRQPLPRRGPKLPGFLDPVTQASPGPGTMPSTQKNFEGLSNADQSSVSGFVVLPPDTNGDVGPTHYVQWVNLAFAIYGKDGTKLYGPAAGNTLWTGFGAPCATRNDGDPIVLYDHLADRWLMSQFAFPNGFSSGPYYQCIAVSQTSDPTGPYHRYAFKISDTKLNDYPKFGVWSDGYYMAINQFVCSFSCSWAGQGVVAFERAKILSGDTTAKMAYFDLYSVDRNLGGMLPSDLDGPAPPAGTLNYFVEVDDDAWGYSPDQLQIWGFHVDWTTPSNSTFTKLGVLTTAPFDSNMCGYSRNCVPQPGTTRKVDAISDRLMYRLQYRNFGPYASLVVNHTVDVDGFDHAGIRWYELRNTGSGWSIYQQGTYAPDGDHRWMGSLAMDSAGNMALGFSVSGTTTYPSIRYTGRLAGDLLGSMTQGEAILIGGAGSQTSSSSRWGDYSMLGVDPLDGCTFWYTQEYYLTTSSASWHTRIGSFKFSSCGVAASGADLSISMADAPDPVTAGATLTYTLAVNNAGPETATGVSVTDTLPAGVTSVKASGTGWTCSGTGPVTCTMASLAVGVALPITITVTAPTAGGAITNAATVSSATADPNSSNNTAAATTTVQTATSTSLSVLRPNGGETWKISTRKTIQWSSSVVGGNVEIALSRNGGGSWEILFASTPNDASETWSVTGPATSAARIRVCTVSSPSVCDTSDGNFVIK